MSLSYSHFTMQYFLKLKGNFHQIFHILWKFRLYSCNKCKLYALVTFQISFWTFWPYLLVCSLFGEGSILKYLTIQFSKIASWGNHTKGQFSPLVPGWQKSTLLIMMSKQVLNIISKGISLKPLSYWTNIIIWAV